MRTEFLPELDAEEASELIHEVSAHTTIRSVNATALSEFIKRLNSSVVDAAHEEYPFDGVLQAMLVAACEAWPVQQTSRISLDQARAVHGEQLLSGLQEILPRSLSEHLREASAAKRLSGITPNQRYVDYVETWGASHAKDFCNRYVVALLAFAHYAEGVVHNLARLDADLVHDAKDLAETFGITPDDSVDAVEMSGDTHHRGGRVSVIYFGSGKKVVWKPRTVDGEWLYSQVCQRLHGVGLSFPAAQVVRREGHGWMEYIAGTNRSQVADEIVAGHTGRTAALLWILNSQDMHMENMLWTARGPVPIDLESILHPARCEGIASAQRTRPNAFDVLARSIYGVGVLPMIVMRAEGRGDGWLDVGFLGDRAGGNSPYRQLSYQDPFTDVMRVELTTRNSAQVETALGTARSEAQTRAIAEAFASGFFEVVDVLLKHRELLIASLEELTPGLRLRYIHNPTVLYAQVLRSLTSPVATADEDVSRTLATRIGLGSRKVSPTLVSAEVSQLLAREIPYFMHDPTESILRDAVDREVAVNDTTAMDDVRAKIETAAQGNTLELQASLIHTAFCAQVADNDLPLTRRAPRPSLGRELAEELVAAALPDRFDHLPLSWIGSLAGVQHDRPWPPGVLGYDLYTGRTGVALALAAAVQTLPGATSSWVHCVDRTFGPMADIITSGTYESRSIAAIGAGALTGMAGVAWALDLAGQLLGRTAWRVAAQDAVALTLEEAAVTRGDDLTSGLSGTWALLAAVDSDAVGDLGSKVVERIASGLDSGVSAQVGMAHGVAGVLHALASRGTDDQFCNSAPELVARLESFFSLDYGSWLSNNRGSGQFTHGWCHGSVGVLAALSATWQRSISVGESGLDVGLLDARIRQATWNVLNNSFGRNLTWCHGDLGALAVLESLTGTRFEVPDQLDQARRRLSTGVIDRKLRDNHSRYSNSNSLLVGRAGVLWHLCREAAPGSLPTPIFV